VTNEFIVFKIRPGVGDEAEDDAACSIKPEKAGKGKVSALSLR